jgi:MFS family permease
MATSRTAFRLRDASVIGLLIAGAALGNFLGPGMVRGAWDARPGFLVLVVVLGVVAAVAGAIVGVIGLVVTWAALGRQRWTMRLSVALVVMAFLYAALILGYIVFLPFGWHPGWRQIVEQVFLLPSVFLAAQLPLWILRFALGWRIVRRDEEEQRSRTASRQFTLRDLFSVMSLLAVTLGLARLGFWIGHRGYVPPLDFWLVVLFTCLAWAVWSAFFTLPCLWAGLIAQNKRASAELIAFYVLVTTAVGVATHFASPPAQAMTVFLLFLGFLFFLGGLVGLMLGVLHVFRGRGWVLHRAGRRRPKAPPEERPGTVDPGQDFLLAERHEPA